MSQAQRQSETMGAACGGGPTGCFLGPHALPGRNADITVRPASAIDVFKKARAIENAAACCVHVLEVIQSDLVSDITLLLSAIEQGDPRAAGELLPLVYDELRRLA